MTAHRVAFLDTNGYLPEVVTHTCDNPPCVNPTHLKAGTWQSNMDDKYARGRAVQVNGECHGMAKLTWPIVYWIRASSLSNAVVADWTGLRRSSIWAIRQRKSWTIDEPL